MKTTFLCVYLLAGVALAACRPNSADDLNNPNPQTDCKPALVTYTQEGETYSDRTEYLYEYWADGQPLKQTGKGQLKNKQAGTTSDYSSVTTYTYDAGGFLTSQVDEYSRTYTDNGKPISHQTRNTTQYEYTNDRIKRETTRITGSDGQTRTQFVDYAYDVQGNLVKKTEDSYDGGSYISTYEDGKMISYVYRASNGKESSQYILENGLVKQRISDITPTYFTKYVYDAQERPVREESWSDGKLMSLTVTDYTEGRFPLAGVPVRKGFPKLKSKFGTEGLAKKRTETNVATGQTQFESTSAYTLNASGYPTDIQSTYLDAYSSASLKPRARTTMTIRYTQCPQ